MYIGYCVYVLYCSVCIVFVCMHSITKNRFSKSPKNTGSTRYSDGTGQDREQSIDRVEKSGAGCVIEVQL